MAQKMTGTEAAVIAVADEVRACHRVKKELEIKAIYKTELATLYTNSSLTQLRSSSQLLSDTPLQHSFLSQPKASHSIEQASVVVISSDSDSDTCS